MVASLGENLFLTKAFSYSVGVVTSYTLNRAWTFKSKVSPAHSFYPFLGVNLISIAKNAVLMIVFVDFLFLSEPVALVLITGITFVWNFLASKTLVFKGLENTRVRESNAIARLEVEVRESSA